MPQRRVLIPEIGEVILAKRRGAKNIRLSVTAKGEVRIGMPLWAPYAAGIAFAKNHSSWIRKHTDTYKQKLLHHGMAIGKAHRLYFRQTDDSKISSRVTDGAIEVFSALSVNNQLIQDKAQAAAEKALRAEATHLLPQRLQVLASRYGFSYKEAKIRKLTSRWGSCSQDKTIVLSYFLIQLPWNLIDYVLLHELVHTQQMNHGSKFWQTFERILPDAKRLRKEIHKHKPRLEPGLA